MSADEYLAESDLEVRSPAAGDGELSGIRLGKWSYETIWRPCAWHPPEMKCWKR
jgi:hypothetical protein